MQNTCYEGVQEVSLNALNRARLQKWISDFSKDHSPKYIRNAWGLLYSAVSMFRDGFDVNVTLPQRNKEKIQIPQEAEIKAIYEAVKGTGLEVPFLLATQCGLGASEIAGLRKTDVDPKSGTIRICQARVTGEYGAVVKTPKSYAGYRELLCAETTCKLCLLAPGEYVTELTAKQICNYWYVMMRRSDLPKYNFHALRHYFASWAALIGIPKEYLVEMMGHSSSRMLDQVYLHTFRERKLYYSQVIAERATALFVDDATQNAT